MSLAFGGSESSSDVSDNEDNLPYPIPLPRSSFLTLDFSPTTYLSSLRNRHQTLEDLRSELRSRSQLLSKELLDLVNTNYQDFLSLGGSLKGGEEKVEEVRVGLLGFKRDVEGIKRKVEERRKEVEGLMGERACVRREIRLGRALCDFASRLEELEGRLMVDSDTKNGAREYDIERDFLSESDVSDDATGATYETGSASMSSKRLQRLVQNYLLIKHVRIGIGPEHPFIMAQDSRMERLRNTLLLDLGTALKQAKSRDEEDTVALMRVLGIYREMGECREAIITLNALKS
ncbi:MAG: hypothetical protein M1827_000240 [Pycnora praestabilis]|nr:MAG: hypothetical protein M1827_000240 [Pycnora praestabilis]